MSLEMIDAVPVGRDMGPSLRWDDGWGEVALREREEEKRDPGSGGGVTVWTRGRAAVPL